MARATKAAVEEVEETEVVEAEQTPKQVINEGISRVLESAGIGVQHARYKAMRAIAYQAFVNAIEDGSFEDLVDQAIANADELPSGWELERPAKEDEPVKKTATKAPAKTAARKPAATKSAAAKPAARRRPTR